MISWYLETFNETNQWIYCSGRSYTCRDGIIELTGQLPMASSLRLFTNSSVLAVLFPPICYHDQRHRLVPCTISLKRRLVTGSGSAAWVLSRDYEDPSCMSDTDYRPLIKSWRYQENKQSMNRFFRFLFSLPLFVAIHMSCVISYLKLDQCDCIFFRKTKRRSYMRA